MASTVGEPTKDNQLGVGSLLGPQSAVPVAVHGVGGVGTLTGVKSVIGAPIGFTQMFCAVLTSGGVDCWGAGPVGDGSQQGLAPVVVSAIGGIGPLSGVTGLATDYYASICAIQAQGGLALSGPQRLRWSGRWVDHCAAPARERAAAGRAPWVGRPLIERQRRRIFTTEEIRGIGGLAGLRGDRTVRDICREADGRGRRPRGGARGQQRQPT